MESCDGIGVGTLLAHLGETEKVKGAVIPPLYQNSLFTFETVAELFDSMVHHPDTEPYHYSRVGNPTVRLAADKIAALEGTEDCILTGSGMAAISLACMSVLEHGAHAVVVDTVYGPARAFLTDYLSRFGITYTFVDGRCPDEVIEAIQADTKLVYLESPSSIVFRLQDLRAITAECRKRGVTTVIDNTFAGGLLQRPHAMGVDLVVHSVTKYLGGHSDLTAGAICGNRARLDKIVRAELALFGSILAPFPAWLLTRGLRTLEVRMERHSRSSTAVAQWLTERPEVERVLHVGLPDFEQAELYRHQMSGCGGLFSFIPKAQSQRDVERFCNALKVFQRGVSWGGFESLAIPLKVQPMGWSAPAYVVRLFIGLEDPKDLLADLQQAFEATE